jgi:hypothetical protein
MEGNKHPFDHSGIGEEEASKYILTPHVPNYYREEGWR